MDNLSIRAARSSDLPAIIALIADDQLGQVRDDASLPLQPEYSVAFQAIDADPNHLLIVAVSDDRIVGTLQLAFLPGLARRGAWRGQIEAVRIAADCRNAGFGRQMIEWAIAMCRTRGCAVVQLTTDKSRRHAHRFYERLGFKPSHEGYKLAL
jgi:GNAT superfamily N-acetyltransferase